MARYVLIAVSLLLAASDFMRPTSIHFETVTGRVLAALSYAFTPAAVGAIIALIKHGSRKGARNAKHVRDRLELGMGRAAGDTRRRARPAAA